MPHIKSKTVYSFDELDDQAKERARDWWRQGETEDSDWSCMHDDFARVADILGIDLRQRLVKLMNGSTRYEPAIYWSGFSSQGDGACFEGSYSYAKGAAKKIKKYAPLDTTLHQIAAALGAIQRSAFYRLSATVKQSGHYYHEYGTEIDVDLQDGTPRDDQVEAIKEALRDFMRWMYRSLEKEHEWRMADEQVDENIRANEYEFEEDGRRAC